MLKCLCLRVYVCTFVCAQMMFTCTACVRYFFHAKFNNIKLWLCRRWSTYSKCLYGKCGISHPKHCSIENARWKLCHLVFHATVCLAHTDSLPCSLHWFIKLLSIAVALYWICCNRRSHFVCIDKINEVISDLFASCAVGAAIESFAYVLHLGFGRNNFLRICLEIEVKSRSISFSRWRCTCGVVWCGRFLFHTSSNFSLSFASKCSIFHIAS